MVLKLLYLQKIKMVLKGKKKLMLKALYENLGVVTHACKAIKITNVSHYNWIREDPEYKKAVEEMPDIVIDNVESELFKLIKSGHAASIMFYLKTKAKDRGYVEKQEIDSNIKINTDMEKLRESIRNGNGLPRE